MTKIQISHTADRCYNYAVALCPGEIEPIEVQEAIHKIHHMGNQGRACFTEDDDFGYATSWRHPTPLELRVWLRKNGNFRVELELHTRTITGQECITFKGTSERFFWSEVMTHRNSRNASSSRAIPYKRMREWIKNDPAMPIHFGSNQSGMQSGAEIQNVNACERELLDLLDYVYDRMDGIVTRYDLHKEWVNRYPEPWGWINWVASFSRPAFHNMLNLRAEENANPNFQRLAVNMARLYRASTPIELQPGDWHMPMIRDFWDTTKLGSIRQDEILDATFKKLLHWSVARSAWTSYQTVDEKIATYEEALRRHDSCVQLLHATPCEHQNEARGDDGRNGGTMPGFNQYRHMIPGESRPEFDFSKLDTTYKNVDFVVKG